jgi:hypothetical protein
VGQAVILGVMQLACTIHSADLRCFRRYFETEGSNQEVIKWEEQMTELRETGDCGDSGDDDADIDKDTQM